MLDTLDTAGAGKVGGFAKMKKAQLIWPSISLHLRSLVCIFDHEQQYQVHKLYFFKF